MSVHAGRPEFSFVVAPSEVPEAGAAYTLEASPAARAALAARFGLIALESFSARLHLARLRAGPALRLTGRIRARVVQRCVVTLEPVPAEIDAPVDILLRPAGTLGAEVETDQDVEPYDGDAVDLGEIAAEELSLALDPYPRAPEAGPRGGTRYRDGPAEDGPFAGLAALRKRR